MTRRGVLAAMAAVGVSLIAGACGLFPAKYWFRMTVEVDTPQGLRTGSSVLEVSSRLQNIPGRGGPSPLTDLKGEAVAVDLPNGRTLFALLSEGWASYATLGFEPDYRSEPDADGEAGQFVEAVRKLGQRDQRGRSIVLPIGAYPRLVTFRDINDPTSVQAVEPANLASSFGPGVKLRRITLEITGDSVTSGIDKRLKWLPETYDKMLDGSTINNSHILANRLSQSDFQRGTR